jgi:hypothetical protein
VNQEALNLAQNTDLFRHDYMIATSSSISARGVLSRKVTERRTGRHVCLANEQNFYFSLPIDLFKETSAYYIKRQEERLAKIGRSSLHVLG